MMRNEVSGSKNLNKKKGDRKLEKFRRNIQATIKDTVK